MTDQIADTIIYNNEVVNTFNSPIPSSLHPDVIELEPEQCDYSSIAFSTACWREYFCTWEIKDERIYLNKVQGRYALKKAPVFADWVNMVLCLPHGEVLVSFYQGREILTFETEVTIEQGRVVKIEEVDNREKDWTPEPFIFPEPCGDDELWWKVEPEPIPWAEGDKSVTPPEFENDKKE